MTGSRWPANGCPLSNPDNIMNSKVLALTALTTASLLLNARADISTGLVGYWAFNDGSGSSTAADSSGNGNDGTLTGFSDGTFTTMWTANGKLNGAILFNQGSDTADYVSINDADDLNFGSTVEFTVAAWVKLSAAPYNNETILCKGYVGAEEYGLDFTSAGKCRFSMRNGGGGTEVAVVATNTISQGTWYHLVGVYNKTASNEVIYVNGVSNAVSGNPFQATVLTNTSVVSIGNAQSTAGSAFNLPFKGTIDDVHLYNRALSASDVFQLYTNTSSSVPLFAAMPSSVELMVGANVQLAPTAVAGGLPPYSYSYQWQMNGTNIAGATSSLLVITNAGPAAAGPYDLIVSEPNYSPAATSSVVLVTITPDLTFNLNGADWSAQGSTVAWLGNNVLQLTADKGSEANSAFYSLPLYIGAFQATFTYRCVTGPSGSADGATFCLQNDPRGAAATGTGGGDLGVGGASAITPSVEFEFNIYANNSVGGLGVSFDQNGAIGRTASTAPLVINSGDPIQTVFTYQNGVATVTLKDTTTGAQYSTSTELDIPSILSTNLAYIGFTGADGGSKSTQQVSNFTFLSLVDDLAIQASGNTAVISWAAGVGGYVLQQNSSLATTNWVNVTNAVNLVNGQNQVVAPITSGARFYRLSLE